MSYESRHNSATRWAIALSAVLLTASLAGAQGPRVVLVTNHQDAAIVPLLEAELRRHGIETVRIDHAENEVVPRDLSAAARTTNAMAGFRVIVAQGTVEVWIADRVTGKVTLREILEQHANDYAGRSTIVLRAVELLRVSLMELEAPHPPRGDIAPPEGIEPLVGFPESGNRFGLRLGMAVAWISKDVSPLLTANLSAWVALHPRIWLGVDALLSTTSPQVEGPEGAASIQYRLFLLTAGYRFTVPTQLLQASLRAGGGLVWTSFRGDAEAPLLELEEHLVGGAITIGGRVGLRLIRRLHVYVDAQGAYLLPRPALDFVDRRAASFSAVSVVVGAGFEILLP